MSTQPEALRLAEWLDKLDVRSVDRIQNCISASTELRRLHEVNTELLDALQEAYEMLGISYPLTTPDSDKRGVVLSKANAVIAKATGGFK